MQLYSPKAKKVKRDVFTGREWEDYETVISHYNRIKNNWTVLPEDTKTVERLKLKTYNHIFGEPGVTKFETVLPYDEINTVMQLKIPFDVWDRYDVHQRAKILAVNHLKNMISIIHRYEEMKIENEKKRKRDLEARNNKGKR